MRVLGDELDPPKISEMLGVQPTRAGRKGEPIFRRDGRVSRQRHIGAWLFEVTPPAQSTLDEAINELLDQLPAEAATRQTLTTRFEVDLLCDDTVRGVNQGFELTPATLKRVACLGVAFGVDVFAEPDPEQARGLDERFGDVK